MCCRYKNGIVQRSEKYLIAENPFISADFMYSNYPELTLCKKNLQEVVWCCAVFLLCLEKQHVMADGHG